MFHLVFVFVFFKHFFFCVIKSLFIFFFICHGSLIIYSLRSFFLLFLNDCCLYEPLLPFANFIQSFFCTVALELFVWSVAKRTHTSYFTANASNIVNIDHILSCFKHKNCK